MIPKVAKRFWSKVAVCNSEDCWEWQAGRSGDGYGGFDIDGTTARVHRVVWALENGPVPEGLCVLYKCDNPTCCNPAHLFLDTRQDNMADRDKKGRTVRGEQHGYSKLTKADIIEIRIQYNMGGVTQKSLGLEFGVESRNIGCIVRGKTWKHVEDVQ